jgi:branched-chain amino acid aminotransferase
MPAIFETIRVRHGRIPLLTGHLARLGASLWRLGQTGAPPGLEYRLRRFESEGELVLRVTIEGSDEWIETRKVPEPESMRIVTSSVRHSRYEIKSVERDTFERARAEAESRGADEALLLTVDGYLAEGSITSLFFWSDELLCVPDAGLGILPGVGRERVLKLAREAGFAVAHGRFVREALGGRSAFLTNAVRGVIAIAALDGEPVLPDPRTATLAERFWG